MNGSTTTETERDLKLIDERSSSKSRDTTSTRYTLTFVILISYVDGITKERGLAEAFGSPPASQWREQGQPAHRPGAAALLQRGPQGRVAEAGESEASADQGDL